MVDQVLEIRNLSGLEAYEIKRDVMKKIKQNWPEPYQTKFEFDSDEKLSALLGNPLFYAKYF